MIVLGVSPGVRSLAYCLLALRPGERFPQLIESALSKGGRPRSSDNKTLLTQRARPHGLELSVVLERAWDDNEGHPVVVGIGPGAPKEPSLHQLAARIMLTGLCVELEERGVRIECHNWADTDELDQVLGMTVRKAIRQSLNQRKDLIRGPYILAAGSALAALEKSKQLLLHK